MLLSFEELFGGNELIGTLPGVAQHVAQSIGSVQKGSSAMSWI